MGTGLSYLPSFELTCFIFMFSVEGGDLLGLPFFGVSILYNNISSSPLILPLNKLVLLLYKIYMEKKYKKYNTNNNSKGCSPWRRLGSEEEGVDNTWF